MALLYSVNCKNYPKPFSQLNPNFPSQFSSSTFNVSKTARRRFWVANLSGEDSQENQEMDSLGVKAALSVLRFYKREISPMLMKSCRYVPTCSEYSMIAYKKYGFAKGTILTTWRICRCNPFGGSGFDPPRWFDETNQPEK